MDETPDYSQYSVEQLSDTLACIIKEEAPNHYLLVMEELARRLNQSAQGPHIIEEARSIPELAFSLLSPILQLQLLNAAEYGSIVLLGIVWPIYEESVHPSDMPIGSFLVMFTIVVLAVAAAGFSCMRDSLRYLEDQDFALHQSLVALFWAPPSSIGGIVLGYLFSSCVPLFPLRLMLCFMPLCFVLPFVIMTIKAKRTLASR